MERPSHISFHAPHMSRRLPLFALAASLQVGAALLIMTGLGHFTPIKDAVLRVFPDPKPAVIDKTPPITPIEIKPVTQHIDDPTFKTAPDPGSTAPRGTVDTKTDDTPKVPLPPAQPDHLAIGITATHTIPPYPATAIRQGVEGTVLLRLTVAQTGRVARAEVMTSSGSEALDQAAQAWILMHWAYKPAQDKGEAVASQTLANVTFNLKNAR
jgi:protein TonB